MQILRRLVYYGFLALLVYMPFHIFLSQSVSLVTGGLEVWKIGKDVLLFGLAVFTICLVIANRKGGRLFYWLLGLTVVYGLLHLLLWAVNPNLHAESAMLGIIFNNRLPCLLLIGFGAYILNKDKFAFSSLIKIVLGVSTLVALLAVLQYLLPKDILTHVGYSLERGVRPAFFIDDNPTLSRVMSTLREPNALGAYLIVPLSLLIALFVRIRDQRRRILLLGMLLLHGLALFLTFSRSAWLGAVLAVSIVLWWSYHHQVQTVLKRFWPLAASVLIVIGVVAFMVRDSQFFQQYIIHSDPEETVADLDSNDYHALLLREGLEGVTDNPFGQGPGTAGLASIKNPGGGQLTENYYVQIAYEVGIAGLALFIAISVIVYLKLWNRRDYIGLALVASFWGYVVMNTLLHTWSNEAVAAQWWLLAGAAIAGATASGTSASTKPREHA